MKCGKESCQVDLDFRIDCFLIPLDFNDGQSAELEHWICPVCGWESVE
jgi:hypothetical protein